MTKTRYAIVTVLSLLALLSVGCAKKEEISQTVDPAMLQMFSPLPKAMPAAAGEATEAQVNLGRMLYYETRLSTDQKIACNTCHKLDTYGVDNEPTSTGHNGQKGSRNSPTVYNAAAHVAQFWDGRAATVEDQAKGPVMNPVEMAMPGEKTVVAVLKSMPEYVKAFKEAFPGDGDAVTFDNMAKAIGAFERKLITPGRWDRFLGGKNDALTPVEKVGFNTFLSAGCHTCHSGALVGGGMYQKLGVMKPYPEQKDQGRFDLTKNDAEKMVFKVPSLRNIEKTAPYFHNGKVATLEDAVARMGEYQVGKQLTSEQIKAIVAWLKTLTGVVPVDYVAPPKLPESTSKTPKPETAE